MPKYGQSPSGLAVPETVLPRETVVAQRREKPRSYRTREWNPNNPMAFQRRPDEAYLEELHKIDPNLEITWNAMLELWQVWVVDITIGTTDATAYTKGWRLLFTLREAGTREYAPLDNRLFALLYAHDMGRFGGASGYYDELKRRAAEQEAALDRDKYHLSQETSRALWDYATPSVGYTGKAR